MELRLLLSRMSIIREWHLILSKRRLIRLRSSPTLVSRLRLPLQWPKVLLPHSRGLSRTRESRLTWIPEHRIRNLIHLIMLLLVCFKSLLFKILHLSIIRLMSMLLNIVTLLAAILLTIIELLVAILLTIKVHLVSHKLSIEPLLMLVTRLRAIIELLSCMHRVIVKTWLRSKIPLVIERKLVRS